MRKIRVVQILEATLGGTATHLNTIVDNLPSDEFELHAIVSPVRNPGVVRELEELFRNRVQVDSFGEPSSQKRVYSVEMTREISPMHDLVAFTQILRSLLIIRPDLVHTHSSKAGFLGRLAARLLFIPVIHTPHFFAFEWGTTVDSRRIYRWLEIVVRWTTSRLVLLHQEQKQRAQTELFYKESRLVVIPNGVDLVRFHPADSKERDESRACRGIGREFTVIGIAARFDLQKGLIDFLHAARIVLSANASVLFLLAGSGPYDGVLKKRAGELGLLSRLRFEGEVRDMPSFYHALDLFCLPSLWEGMPYVLLESMASGVPVVATETSGAKAIIEHNRTGVLTPLGNPEALAEALLHLVDSGERSVFMKENAILEVHHRYDVHHFAEQLALLYRVVLSENSKVH